MANVSGLAAIIALTAELLSLFAVTISALEYFLVGRSIDQPPKNLLEGWRYFGFFHRRLFISAV